MTTDGLDTLVDNRDEERRFGVLVVDDEEHLALMFRDALLERGYACDAVFSPLDARERLSKGNYAILVSDINMPNMTGIRLMEESLASNPALKTIFVTGVSDVETAVLAMKKGASHFVRKPFELHVLCKKVDAIARALSRTDRQHPIAFEEPDTHHCPDLPGYQILKPIGVGAMGSVFQARQVTLNRNVAVKVIRPSAFKSDDALRRFETEARAAAKMNHPNIIQVYDLLRFGRFVYIVMEYFVSKSLQQVVVETGPMPCDKALWVVLQVTRALIHSSSQGIIHRDVKPSNILIGKGWTAKLADFGLAKETTLVGKEANNGSGTRVGSVVGTPAYLSPEQASAAPDVDVRSDIYSLGLCLYFMLEGHDPYKGDIVELIRSHLLDPLPDVQAEGITPSVRALIARTTKKDRLERFQTGSELLSALRQAGSS